MYQYLVKVLFAVCRVLCLLVSYMPLGWMPNSREPEAVKPRSEAVPTNWFIAELTHHLVESLAHGFIARLQ